jgi:uncharacterized membrane protein
MSDKKSLGSKKTSKIAKNLLEVIIGLAIFVLLIIALLAFLIKMIGPDGPNMDRTFRAFLPFLIVGACIAIVLIIGIKIAKKQKKK